MSQNNIDSTIKSLLEVPSVQDRIKSKYEQLGPDDCWPWKGAKTNGYGKYSMLGKLLSVHRIIAFWKGLDIDRSDVVHVCGQKDCCNPKHIDLKHPPYSSEDRLLRVYPSYNLWFKNHRFYITQKGSPIEYEFTETATIEEGVKLFYEKQKLIELRDGRFVTLVDLAQKG